jgi:hypothetical protein
MLLFWSGVDQWGIIKHSPDKRILKSSEHPKDPVNLVEKQNKNEERELSSVDHRVLGQ